MLDLFFLLSEPHRIGLVASGGRWSPHYLPSSCLWFSLLLSTAGFSLPLVQGISVPAAQQLWSREVLCIPAICWAGGLYLSPGPAPPGTVIPPFFTGYKSFFGGEGGSLQLLLLLLDDLYLFSPVPAQLYQPLSCSHLALLLSFMVGMRRQEVSKYLAKLSFGEGRKWVKCSSQVLMALTLQDYLFPLFRSVLCTRLSEQQQLQAVGELLTHWFQSCLLSVVDFY